MNTRITIIGCILLFWTASAFGQGTWVQFVTSINGKAPAAGSFLNEKFGFAETTDGWFRTSDGGTTWRLTSGLPIYSANHLNFYYYTPDTIFVNGKYESVDSGYNWFGVPSPATSNSIYIKDGITYDGAGRISTDGMRTWKAIPYFRGGETVVGNLADGIAMWDIGTTYSENNGASWFSGGIGVESDFGYAIPFTNTYIRNGGDGYDAIQRSIDGGASWQTMYGFIFGRYFSDGIAGDGCTVYVQTTGAVKSNSDGLFRSTDAGTTWTNIGGPPSYDDYPICGAMTRGTVCFATGNFGSGIWKYSDPSSYRPASEDAKIRRLFPDTLFTNDCDSVTLRLAVSFSACDYIRMHSVGIDNLSVSLYGASFTPNNIIRTGRPDSASVTIHPTLAGTYNLLVHLTLSASDWSTIDTVFPVTIIVNSVKPRLDILPKNMDFGRTPICAAAEKDSILLWNLSCEAIFISDIRFEIDSQWVPDFTFSAKSPYKLSVSTRFERIILDYHPLKPGTRNGRIVIVTNLGNDTIPVYADTYPDSSRLVIEHPGAITFPPQTLCNAGGYDTLHLSNPGCTDLIIGGIYFSGDSVSQNDFSLTNSGADVLKAYSNPRTIFITFHPLSSGAKTGYIIIETNMGTYSVLVSALILPDAKVLAIRSDSLSAPLCDSIDGNIYLHNISCRQMRLEELFLQNQYKLLPVSFPIILDPGDSARVSVRFLPSKQGSNSFIASAKLNFYEPLGAEEFDTTIVLTGFGMPGPFAYSISTTDIIFDTLHLCDSANARLIIHSIGCDSLPIDAILFSGDSDFQVSGVQAFGRSEVATGDSLQLNISLKSFSTGNKSGIITLLLGNGERKIINLGAIVISPRRILFSKEQGTIDFGTRLTCETPDTLITLINPGCDTVRVSDIGLRGSGFGLGNSFPIIIPPGEGRTIDVKTIPDTAGGKLSNADTLSFTTDADNTLLPIMLSENYITPYPVHLWLEGSQTPMPTPSLWTMQIKGMPQELGHIHSIDLAMNYNTDLLGYNANKSTAASSDGGIHFHIASPNIASDSSIAEITFDVYLAKDTSTAFSLSNIIFNASDPKFTGCVAIPLSSGTTFTYFNSCGDPTIRHVLRGEPLQFRIYPNPAQDEIFVDSRWLVDGGQMPISIFDALGKNRTYMSYGTYTPSIDLRNYPPGIYIVRIGSASASFLKVR